MSKARILVVENELLIAMGLQDVLDQAGFECRWIASSVASAREHLAKTDFDAVVLDAHLSDGPADALADEISAKGLPFVCHTGYGPESLAPPLRAGIVVTKPAAGHELVRAVHTALAHAPTSRDTNREV